MKETIETEFQKLINGTKVTRPPGWEYKVGMYRKALKAFRNTNSNLKELNSAVNVLKTRFKNPESMIEKSTTRYGMNILS